MTTTDVDRLYIAVESLRQDVRAYQSGLDARVSALEDESVALAAERKTRRDLLRFGMALGATAAAVATTLNFLFLHIGE